MTIGEFIISYRKEHGISQRAFAKLANLSYSYIGILETGRNTNGSITTPSIETYNSIAKAVGLSLFDLLKTVQDDVVINPVFTVEEQMLILSFRKASDRDKEIIHKVLDSYLESEEEDTSSAAG